MKPSYSKRKILEKIIADNGWCLLNIICRTCVYGVRNKLGQCKLENQYNRLTGAKKELKKIEDKEILIKEIEKI